jgi:hypothetical protein
MCVDVILLTLLQDCSYILNGHSKNDATLDVFCMKKDMNCDFIRILYPDAVQTRRNDLWNGSHGRRV